MRGKLNPLPMRLLHIVIPHKAHYRHIQHIYNQSIFYTFPNLIDNNKEPYNMNQLFFYILHKKFHQHILQINFRIFHMFLSIHCVYN